MKKISFLVNPFKYLLTVFLLVTIFYQLVDTTGMFIPLKRVSQEESITRKSLKFLGAPKDKMEDLTQAVRLASISTDLREELIVALIKTESNFKNKAVSNKNYKGLMQTPTATFIYSDVDVLHGARILKDKLRITDGNLLRALTLYKGGNNPVARKYALETLALYNTLLNETNKGG